MLNSGEVFAGYTVERLLGQGGMGSVYLARHPRFARQTALKLLNPELFTDAEVRARFEREADLVAQLDHPGIVTVFDRGSEQGQLWIAMQYVDGVDAAAVNPMTLPPERAVQIIEGVADALDYAHGMGVLHRDVKPANIMLARASGGQKERVFLTDFGIARLREDSTHLTQTGMFTATLAYASPEQMTGGHLDPRTDQYALACALYWLLAGVGPFDADNPADIIKGHLQLALPPLAVRRRGLNPALDAVLAAGMAKRPEYRYNSCAEFAAAARHALTTTSGPRLPPPPVYPTPYPPPTAPPAQPIPPPAYQPAPNAAPPGYAPVPPGYPPPSGFPPAPGYAPPAGYAGPPAGVPGRGEYVEGATSVFSVEMSGPGSAPDARDSAGAAPYAPSARAGVDLVKRQAAGTANGGADIGGGQFAAGIGGSAADSENSDESAGDPAVGGAEAASGAGDRVVGGEYAEPDSRDRAVGHEPAEVGAGDRDHVVIEERVAAAGARERAVGNDHAESGTGSEPSADSRSLAAPEVPANPAEAVGGRARPPVSGPDAPTVSVETTGPGAGGPGFAAGPVGGYGPPPSGAVPGYPPGYGGEARRARPAGALIAVVAAGAAAVLFVAVGLFAVLVLNDEQSSDTAASPAAASPTTAAPRSVTRSTDDTDRLNASRRAFPRLLPQLPGAREGYQGAQCRSFRPSDGYEPQEEALRASPWTIAWDCVRVTNDSTRLSFTVLGYDSPADAADAVDELPAASRIDGMKNGVEYTRYTWVVSDPPGPLQPYFYTAKTVIGFEDDPAHAEYLIYVNHHGTSRHPQSVQPSADAEIADWWNQAPL